MFLILPLLYSSSGIVVVGGYNYYNIYGRGYYNTFNSHTSLLTNTLKLTTKSKPADPSKNETTREIKYNRTHSTLYVENVVKIDVVGPGCFVLYEEHNYRKKIGKVYSGFRLTTEIPAVGSIECFPECNNTNIKRYVFGGGSILASILMIAVLFPSLREGCKSKRKRDQEQDQVQKRQDPRKTKGINYSVLWDEVKGWRSHFSWTGALTIIMLGLLPSAMDVSSDYTYAESWQGDDWGYNPQVRALVHFFICLPHLMTLLTALNSWITALFNFPEAHTCIQLLGKSTGLLLYLGIVTAVVFGALQLGWHRPDVFAYISIPSAAITIAMKIAALFVQGPEAKKALTLFTAR